MKPYKYLIILVSIFLLYSCTAKETKNDPVETDRPYDETISSDTTEAIESKEEFLKIDLPQLNKNEQHILNMATGKIAKDQSGTVMLFSDVEYEKNATFESRSEIYLVADVAGQLYNYSLGLWNNDFIINEDDYFNDKEKNKQLFLSDINGDGIDEIILNIQVTGNGGRISQIYQLHDNEIELLSDINEIDFKISIESEDNYVSYITNKALGYSYKIDFRDYGMHDSYYDENGRGKSEFDTTSLRYLSVLNAEDIDGDGMNELKCRYALIMSAWTPGDIYFILDFDTQRQQMKISSMEFVPS